MKREKRREGGGGGEREGALRRGRGGGALAVPAPLFFPLLMMVSKEAHFVPIRVLVRTWRDRLNGSSVSE